jgi:hypothetical protein
MRLERKQRNRDWFLFDLLLSKPANNASYIICTHVRNVHHVKSKRVFIIYHAYADHRSCSSILARCHLY